MTAIRWISKRRWTMKHLRELAFLMLSKEEAQYNAAFKEKFKRVGKKAMIELADLLELREFKWDFNPGGIAVSGDLMLMGMWGPENGVYVSMNKDFPNAPWGQVLYRSIKHMKDYSGGVNQWLRFEELKFPEIVKERVLTLRKGGQRNGEERAEQQQREERESDDHAHQDVRGAAG
jgi:hypothetical protein